MRFKSKICAKNFHPHATLCGQSGHILHKLTEKKLPIYICIYMGTLAVSKRSCIARYT
ncbi:hypothetical protein Peur_072464 [Populus x canadensis]